MKKAKMEPPQRAQQSGPLGVAAARSREPAPPGTYTAFSELGGWLGKPPQGSRPS